MNKPVLLLVLTLGLYFFHANLHAITLKLATLAPNGSTWMNEMKKGADEIKTRTDGRVKFKFYPGGVMGNDQTVHRKIRIKQLHGGAFSSSGLSQINTAIQALSLPMLFNSFDEVDHVRAHIDQRIKEHMIKSGFVILGITEGGFARMMSTKPINTLDDIRLNKVWIPEGDILVAETYNTLGIQPIPLPMSDVFTGLQTGLIDTIASTSAGAIAFQWHSGLKAMVDLPVLYVIGILAVSNDAFERINKDDQSIVIEVMSRVFARLDQLNRHDNTEANMALKNQGLAVFRPTQQDIQELRIAADQAIASMVDKGMIDRVLVEEIVELLRLLRTRQ